jgi:hypothetical protein
VGVWANLLHLRAGTREHFFAQLARDWPQLLPRYRELYRYDAYLPDAAKAPVLGRLAELKAAYEIGDRRMTPIVAPKPVEQLSLLALVS